MVASFGCLIWYKDINPSAFEPKGKPGLFLGAEIIAGQKFKGGFKLEIDGKKPLKEWRILTTSKRLAVELNRYCCSYDPKHRHDPIEGGRMAELSGVYNIRMATAILASLFPQTMFEHVPCMTVVPGAVAHYERGLMMGQMVLGFVYAPMLREEMLTNPQALEKLREEAQAMRDLKVWRDDEPYELEELKAIYKAKKETIHIGEIMPIYHVKKCGIGRTIL